MNWIIHLGGFSFVCSFVGGQLLNDLLILPVGLVPYIQFQFIRFATVHSSRFELWLSVYSQKSINWNLNVHWIVVGGCGPAAMSDWKGVHILLNPPKHFKWLLKMYLHNFLNGLSQFFVHFTTNDKVDARRWGAGGWGSSKRQGEEGHKEEAFV